MIFHYRETPIYYERQGEGPTVVLIHGFLESTTMWHPFLPALSKRRNVVCIDLPGHGQSGCLEETHTMELMADVVISLLESLNIESASFVGHSMGGYVALAIAEFSPEIINTLALMNSTTEADSEERKRNRDRALEALDENPNLFLGLAIGNLFSPENRIRYTQEISRLKEEAMQFPLVGIKAALKGMKLRKDRTEVLRELSSDKIMISATADPIVPFKRSEELANSTESRLISLPGGHMSHMEAHGEIVKILHFIE